MSNGFFGQAATAPQSDPFSICAAKNDLVIELTPVERLMRRTPLLGLGQYRCAVDHPQFRGGGPETCPYIVFGRSSVQLITSRGPPEVCTPVTVNLLDVGDSYERRPVSNEGVDCDWIAVSPLLLREIAGWVDPQLRQRTASVFDRSVAPVSAKVYLAQRNFFTAVRGHADLSTLAVEEAAIRLIAGVLGETQGCAAPQDVKRGGPRKNAQRPREIVEATKGILGREYWSNQSIAELAARVHCSPGYLSRSFSRLSGFTLHEYQQQIRLRTSLQLLHEARFNGAGIALQLGFASHSHFSDVFRRRFGITPTRLAESLSLASLRSMHAVLDQRERECAAQAENRS